MARPVLCGGEAVELLEVAYEVAVVAEADAHHYLLYVEEGALQKPSGFEQPQLFPILCGSHAYLRFEERAQVCGREIDGPGHLAESKLAPRVFLDEVYDLLHSWVHLLQRVRLLNCTDEVCTQPALCINRATSAGG